MFFGIGLQSYSTELFWKNCHWKNKHSPMPGENFKPSSVESDLNACLDQKMHLKSHRWLGSPFCWSTALPKLHSVKPAMPLAFKFGSSTIEHHLTSKELKIFKIFVLLNFKRAESLLGKSDRRQLCTSARVSQIALPKDYLLLSLSAHPLTWARLSES